jgi:hypothetical protein
MGTELLVRPEENERRELSPEEEAKIGGTVFEALAVDSESAIELPEGVEDSRLTMSLTRIPGGQTVPDER